MNMFLNVREEKSTQIRKDKRSSQIELKRHKVCNLISFDYDYTSTFD